MQSRPVLRLLALFAMVAMALTPSLVTTAASAADGTCTPTTETPSISLLKDGQPVSADNPVTAWNSLKVSFAYSLKDGHCAGQRYTVDVPSELSFEEGATWNLKDENGVTVATMTYTKEGHAVITLTGYVETHENIKITGWMLAQIDSDLTPGETKELTFEADGETVTILVPIGTCPNCGNMPENMDKWGNAGPANESGTRSGSVSILFPTLTEEMAGDATSQTVTWTDTLTSDNQAFDCTASGYTYTGRDRWNNPTGATLATIEVTSCTETAITGTVVIPVNQFAQIKIPMTFTGNGPWTDHAMTTMGGNEYETSTKVMTRSAGGDASGDAPAPTPTPEETTPAATSTPAVTPTPEETTPAVTVTTTAPAPGATPPASPTKPSAPALAHTGAATGGLVALVAAFVVAGAFALRRARSTEN